MDKERLFITVIGQDKKGIVVRISGLLYDANVSMDAVKKGGAWPAATSAASAAPSSR